MNNKDFDTNLEAIEIISEHTKDFMQSANYTPETAHDLYETMVEECSRYLTIDFLIEKKYTPMQYNALRNEIARLLYDTFKDHI